MYLLNKQHFDAVFPVLKSRIEEFIDRPLKASRARELVARMAECNTYNGLCSQLKTGPVHLCRSHPGSEELVAYISETHKLTIEHEKLFAFFHYEEYLNGIHYDLLPLPVFEEGEYQQVAKTIAAWTTESKYFDRYVTQMYEKGPEAEKDPVDYKTIMFDGDQAAMNSYVLEHCDPWEFGVEIDYGDEDEELSDEEYNKRYLQAFEKNPSLATEILSKASSYGYGNVPDFRSCNRGAGSWVIEWHQIPHLVKQTLLTAGFNEGVSIVCWSASTFREHCQLYSFMKDLTSAVQEVELYAAVLDQGNLHYLGHSSVYSVNMDGNWNLYDICDMHSEAMTDVYKAFSRYARQQGAKDLSRFLDKDLYDNFKSFPRFSLLWKQSNTLDSDVMTAFLYQNALDAIPMHFDLFAQFDDALIEYSLYESDAHYVFNPVTERPPNLDPEKVEEGKEEAIRQILIGEWVSEFLSDGSVTFINYDPWDYDSQYG